MSANNYNFSEDQLNRLFPFHFILNENLEIISSGKSIKKLLGFTDGIPFDQILYIKRPELEINNFEDLRNNFNHLLIIGSKTHNTFMLRGQIEPLEGDKIIFAGTPWFYSVEEVKSSKLTLNDFALHDPMIDLLHVLKTQDISHAEIKELLEQVNGQKKKLTESEANYRSIVEKATDIIYKVDLDGKFVYVNEIALQITGYDKSELLEMTYDELIREDYREKTREYYINQVSNRIQTTYYEFPILTKKGKEIWIGQSVQFPRNYFEEPTLTALAINISERKHAEQNLVIQEEKYRNIIANMNLGLLEVDTSDKIIYANQSFCNISGYSIDELIGKSAAKLLMSESEKSLISKKNQSRKRGKSDMYTVPVINKQGETRWWMISGAPRYNDNGELIGSVGIHLDITEQKKLESELQIAKLKAEESSRAKESFLAIMSHEIRTPLNAIVGISNLLKINNEARNDENIDILSFSAKNLLSLISDILDLSKINSGMIKFVETNFNFRDVISGTCEMFRPSCEEKKISLLCNIDNSIPEHLCGDELRLTQIINNLLSNAVKFTEKGSVALISYAEKLSEDKTRIYIIVKDSGIGITVDKLDTIFNAFEQADDSIERTFGGTGLGLNITRKLIELQSGSINVDSQAGKGSTFTVVLDFKTEIPAVLPAQDNIIELNTKNNKQVHVLVVEDNLVNQKVLASYLKLWDFTFDIANHGKEALELLSRNNYSIALIDLFMPVMDGFKTIASIKSDKHYNGLPVIALTASAEVTLMDKALAAGAEKCVTKPFNPNQLYKNMTQLLNVSQYKKPVFKKITLNDFQHINLSRITDASLDSNEFIKEMITIFLNEIPVNLLKAEKALQSKDYKAFSSLIHKMKNSLLMIGMDEIKNDLNYLEEKAGKKNTELRVKIAFLKVKEIWEQAQPELQSAYNRLCA